MGRLGKNMSAPVAHIILALLMLPKHFPDKNPKEFIIGTSFPDIRYFGKISREETHTKEVTLEMVQKEPSSFKAGMLFHALVDEVRCAYMEKQNIYNIIPKDRYSDTSLKYFEDILLYEKIKNWDKIISYFDTILYEETAFGIPEKQIKNWHLFIKSYLSMRITPQSSLTLYMVIKYTSVPKVILKYFALILIKTKLLPQKANRIMLAVEQFAKNKALKNIILNFYNNFEKFVNTL